METQHLIQHIVTQLLSAWKTNCLSSEHTLVPMCLDKWLCLNPPMDHKKQKLSGIGNGTRISICKIETHEQWTTPPPGLAVTHMLHANMIGSIMNNTILFFCGHLENFIHHKCNSFMLIRDTVHQSWIISDDKQLHKNNSTLHNWGRASFHISLSIWRLFTNRVNLGNETISWWY